MLPLSNLASPTQLSHCGEYASPQLMLGTPGTSGWGPFASEPGGKGSGWARVGFPLAGLIKLLLTDGWAGACAATAGAPSLALLGLSARTASGTSAGTALLFAVNRVLHAWDAIALPAGEAAAN